MDWLNVKKIALTEEVCGKIYDILVKYAGADEREDSKAEFIFSHTRKDYPSTEFRFCGDLGFGGKFRHDACLPVEGKNRLHGQWWVQCYREDATPGRLKLMEITNKALMKLEDMYAAGQ